MHLPMTWQPRVVKDGQLRSAVCKSFARMEPPPHLQSVFVTGHFSSPTTTISKEGWRRPISVARYVFS